MHTYLTPVTPGKMLEHALGCCICIEFLKVLYMHLGKLSTKFAVLNKLLLEVWKGYALMLVINSLLFNTYAK